MKNDGRHPDKHVGRRFSSTHDSVVTWQSNAPGLRRVFDALACSDVKAFVHVSSVGSYSPGPKDEPGVDEGWPADSWPDAAYCHEKAYLERALDTVELAALPGPAHRQRLPAGRAPRRSGPRRLTAARSWTLPSPSSPPPQPAPRQSRSWPTSHAHDVRGEVFRVTDRDVRPGPGDTGRGVAWPALRGVLLVATPVWLGRPSIVRRRVLERFNAELSRDRRPGPPAHLRQGRRRCRRRNEDQARKVSTAVRRELNDADFSLAPGAVAYWAGEAVQGTAYQDLDETPEAVASTTKTLAANATRLSGPPPRPTAPAWQPDDQGPAHRGAAASNRRANERP